MTSGARLPSGQALRSPASETRSAARTGACGVIVLSLGAGGVHKAALADITEHGCCLDIDGALLKHNQIVSLTIDPARPLVAIVRWIRDGQAGLEFGRALPRNIVDRLASCG